MSLSKICLLMALGYTLTNVAVGWFVGHAGMGALVSIPGDAVIWGIWYGVKIQVRR